MIARRQHRSSHASITDDAAATRVVLGVTADAGLADALRRLGAAAGVEVQLARRPPDVSTWQRSALVVVGAYALTVLSGRLDRRDGIDDRAEGTAITAH